MSKIRNLLDLEEQIKRKVWKQTAIEGDNIIQLLNFHLNGNPLTIKLGEEGVVFQRFLTSIDADRCQSIARLLSQFIDLLVECSDDSMSLVINYPAGNGETYRFIVDTLLQLLNIVIDNWGYLVEKSLGVVKVAILDKNVYVLKRRDIDNFLFLKGLVVTIPDYNGWIEANTGKDNLYLPLLSWINEKGELEIGYVTGEKKLESVNLTKVTDKVIKVSDDINLPSGISELDLVKKDFLVDAIWKLRALHNGTGTMGFFKQKSLSIERDELSDLLNELMKIEKAVAFNDALMNRVATRVASGAISTGEKEQLPVMGEEIIASTLRKVTRLGGGKAIYIGKEELKHINLSEKANVKVVKMKDGKTILIIEPL